MLSGRPISPVKIGRLHRGRAINPRRLRERYRVGGAVMFFVSCRKKTQRQLNGNNVFVFQH